MAVIQPNGDAVTKTSTKNNSGLICANSDPAGKFSNVQTSYVYQGAFGSTLVDNDSADKVLNAGVFAHNNKKPIALKLTSSLAEVENTFLLSAASDAGNMQGIHKTDSVRTRKLTTAIRENKWNQYSGEFDPGYPQVSLDVFYNIEADDTTTVPVDQAATPTREVPGELVFMQGSKNPVLHLYPKKTS